MFYSISHYSTLHSPVLFSQAKFQLRPMIKHATLYCLLDVFL